MPPVDHDSACRVAERGRDNEGTPEQGKATAVQVDTEQEDQAEQTQSDPGGSLPALRPFVGVGFLGGFTTFSTYAADVRGQLAQRLWVLAGSYAAGSLVAGLAALWLGVALARLSRGLPVWRGRHEGRRGRR